MEKTFHDIVYYILRISPFLFILIISYLSIKPAANGIFYFPIYFFIGIYYGLICKTKLWRLFVAFLPIFLIYFIEWIKNLEKFKDRILKDPILYGIYYETPGHEYKLYSSLLFSSIVYFIGAIVFLTGCYFGICIRRKEPHEKPRTFVPYVLAIFFGSITSVITTVLVIEVNIDLLRSLYLIIINKNTLIFILIVINIFSGFYFAIIWPKISFKWGFYITSFYSVIFISLLYRTIRFEQLHPEFFQELPEFFYALPEFFQLHSEFIKFYGFQLVIPPIYLVATFLTCLGGYIGKKFYDQKILDKFSESK